MPEDKDTIVVRVMNGEVCVAMVAIEVSALREKSAAGLTTLPVRVPGGLHMTVEYRKG